MFNPLKKTKKPGSAGTPARPDQEVLERIIPVIKAILPEDTELPVVELPEKDDTPVSRTLAGDLMVMYAEDLPDHFAFISLRRMAELGLDEEALHALAIRNLPNRVPPIELHGSGPCYMITAGGNLEATLLLHPTLWESLAEYLPGSPIAVVPARDLLLVSSSEWEDGRAMLKQEAAREPAEKRYALSTRLFIKRGDTWEVEDLDS